MRTILYVHGGSGNHGCEAILRTLTPIFKDQGVTVTALTANIKEDQKTGLDKEVEIIPLSQTFNYKSLDFAYAYMMLKLFHRPEPLDRLARKRQIESLGNYNWAIAIGGDTYSYCYSDSNTYTHNLFRRKGMKTALWGCSIDPELLEDNRALEDIKNFDLIVARESITYNALKAKGISNLILLPDSAFSLNTEPHPQRSLMEKDKTIGINVSPLIMNYQKTDGVTLDSYQNLMDYILDSTDNKIALIPHVVWGSSDDREVLNILYDKYKSTNRVILIEDANCMQLKDIISQCRIFVCARTHASIAAYSTCVPTLVLGYSVKARGIAKDIFGTDEHYVLPVQALEQGNQLVEAYKWIEERENNIRSYLLKVIPNYIAPLTNIPKIF